MTERASREEAARKAPVGELRLRIPDAGADYLAGALDNPALTEEHVILIAKSPAASSEILRRIGENKTWLRSYAVKRAIVCHPKSPQALAMSLVKFLFWRDLHLVSDDQFTFPPLRIQAEKALLDRLPQLALGEKMTLGRMSGRAVIPRLLIDKSPMVVEAVLWNGRLTSQELISLIGDQRTAPDALTQIARHPRWSNRAEIRTALAHNPRTPLAISLGLLGNMTERDLTALAEDPYTPQVLKLTCRRLLVEAARKRGQKGS